VPGLSLPSFLPQIPCVVPAHWLRHFGHCNRSFTYSLTYLQKTWKKRRAWRCWPRLTNERFERWEKSSISSPDEDSRKRWNHTTSRTWSNSTQPVTSTCWPESDHYREGWMHQYVLITRKL